MKLNGTFNCLNPSCRKHVPFFVKSSNASSMEVITTCSKCRHKHIVEVKVKSKVVEEVEAEPEYYTPTPIETKLKTMEEDNAVEKSPTNISSVAGDDTNKPAEQIELFPSGDDEKDDLSKAFEDFDIDEIDESETATEEGKQSNQQTDSSSSRGDVEDAGE